MKDFQRQAIVIQSFTLEDGTFANMYAYPDYTTDLDYILNEGASRLRLPEKHGNQPLFDDDCETKVEECLVFGHVLFQRVDEDGTELGIKKDHLIDLFSTIDVDKKFANTTRSNAVGTTCLEHW